MTKSVTVKEISVAVSIRSLELKSRANQFNKADFTASSEMFYFLINDNCTNFIPAVGT